MDKSTLPTKSVLILSTLMDGYQHGYAIRKDVESRTGGSVRIGVTTLYRLLRDLLKAGLVEETVERPAARFDDERRRYFRITPAGRRVVRTELERMERVLEAIRRPLVTKARS